MSESTEAWMECTKEELCEAIAELDRDLAAARKKIEIYDRALDAAGRNMVGLTDEIVTARREAEEMREVLASLNYTICDYLSYDPPIPLTIKDQLSEARRRARDALASTPEPAPAKGRPVLSSFLERTIDNAPRPARDRRGK